MTDLPDDSQQKPPAPPIITGQPVGGKERVDNKPAAAESSGEAKQEETPVTEFTRNIDLEPEVEGWLEKVEKEDSQAPQAIKDDKGQVVLDDTAQPGAGFKVVLPLTKDEVDKGLQHKVLDSIRWLAEWCIRMVKMFGSKVAYRRK
ncbi:MAG: hypothetical protein V1810_03875 [Candidatus Beckwithbacteria bacterium]